MGVTGITITSISQPDNLITLVATVTVDSKGANPSLFNYHLTYASNTYVSATASSQTPSGTQSSTFTLTATFSYADFYALYTVGQSATYYVNYNGTNETNQSYIYVNPTSFTFNSFTVLETTPTQITAVANFTAVGITLPSVEAADFTYTVVIGGTTYTYTSSTIPAITPTVTSNSFTFIFTPGTFTELFQDGDVQTHRLNFTRFIFDLNVTSDPVVLTYSGTPTMTLTFSSIVVDTDPTYILASFAYTYTAFTPITDNLLYKLNGTDITSSDVTWSLNNSTKFGSARFSSGTGQTAPIFIQVASITHQIEYLVTVGDPIGPFYSNILSTVYTIANSNNKAIISPVTVVTISPSKTVILPPVAKVPGTLYHFKILTASSPYTLKIYPFLLPPFTPILRTYLYNNISTPSFDSVIETGTPYIFDSTTTLHTLTLVSDGTNWWILNKYTNTLTINSVSGAPTQNVTETNETNAFQYIYLNSGSYTKILLHAMSYSYLKYIFITNSDSSTKTFNIYMPGGAPLETIAGSSGRYNYMTFNLDSGKVAGFVLTYINGTYYIISAAINPSISSSDGFTDTPTILSSTLSFLQYTNYCQIPFLPSLDSSHAQLVIIKGNTYPIIIRGDTGVLFQLNAAGTPAFSLNYFAAVWFIGIRSGETRQYYLPISYYAP
jgi:hypothetical protein